MLLFLCELPEGLIYLSSENQFFKAKFMDPITLLIAGFLGMQLLKPKKDKPEDEQAGSTTTSKPNISGSPTLTIEDINDRPGQLLDNVKWSFKANNQTGKGKHQSRKEEPITQVIGDYMVVTQTDPTVRPGEKKPDVIMIIVKDRQNRTIIAKRIIVGNKQIIDVQ